MVMGQEERKNKAKLEKTQIQLATNGQEYEGAIGILKETTGRWNREWKIACDVSVGWYQFTRRWLTQVLEIPRPRRGEIGLYKE